MYFLFYLSCAMLQPWSGKTNIRNGKEALIMKKLSKLMKEYYESFSRREG